MTKEVYGSWYRPFFKYQRGDSGQKKIPKIRGRTGRKAEPNSSLKAILPTSCNAKLAQNPKATLVRQLIMRPPRIEAGMFSAAKMGTVNAWIPYRGQATNGRRKSCSQVWQKPESMTERKQKIVLKEIIGTTAPEVEVEWVGKPTSCATEKTSTKESLGDKLERTTKRQQCRGRRSPSRQTSCSCHSLGSLLREEYRTQHGKDESDCWEHQGHDVTRHA